MTRLAVLATGALLLGAACAAGGEVGAVPNPDGPFGDGTSDSVVDLTPAAYDELVKRAGDDRPYNVVFLFVNDEVGGRGCPLCPYMDKQYSDFVASYKRQFRLGDVYTENKLPTYFVRVQADGRNNYISRELRAKSMPSLGVVLSGGLTYTEFGKGGFDDQLAKKLRLAVQAEIDELKKAEDGPAIQRSIKRRERRNRQVQTQEDYEYESYGKRSHSNPAMVNICKWLRVKGGLWIQECPQDVPQDFAEKKKPQDLLKNVLMIVIAATAAAWIGRIFVIGFEQFDSTTEDLRDKVHKQACILDGDEHQMWTRRPQWEIYVGTIGFGLALVVYGLLTGGMYYNILNRRPWSGSAQGNARAQFGQETAMLAILSTTGSVAMLVATHCVSPGFLNFTAKKGPLQMSEDLRATVKRYLSAGGVVVWFMMFVLILKMFLQKNQGYLRGTTLSPFISILRG